MIGDLCFDQDRMMKTGPNISHVASLIGDPSRANMLSALMSGQALTAHELAISAGVQPSTASSHLKALRSAQLITLEKQGRHHYYRLANEETAQALEALSVLSAHSGFSRIRTGPKEPALREARVCYDHLAGDMGVQLYDSLLERKFLSSDEGRLRLSQQGVWFISEFGIHHLKLSTKRRPLCRACLDWSARRHHLAGALGAAILEKILVKNWARRDETSRALIFCKLGKAEFDKAFPLTIF